MLEYEEELELSDSIVARRAVKDLLEEEYREPSDDEMMIIKKGDLAARKLVEAYIPFINKLAAIVFNRNHENKSAVGWDRGDLVNEGVEAALRTANSFNARGSGEHSGVRFAKYAAKNITKAMNRLVARYSTPYRTDVSALQATWTWMSAEDEFKRTHGRNPSDEELSEITGLDPDYVMPNLPNRASFGDVDDPEYTSIPSPTVQSVTDDVSYRESVKLFEACMNNMFPDKYMPAIRIMFALDSNVPYEAEDMASALGISTRKADNQREYIMNFIAHPRYRVWAYKFLMDQQKIKEVSEAAALERDEELSRAKMTAI